VKANDRFNTVDGFQGQEKDIIILSTVRSGSSPTIGFLKDARRMNVALTRAKSSLFVIGNARTLERGDERWKTIVGDARDRGFLIDVRPSRQKLGKQLTISIPLRFRNRKSRRRNPTRPRHCQRNRVSLQPKLPRHSQHRWRLPPTEIPPSPSLQVWGQVPLVRTLFPTSKKISPYLPRWSLRNDHLIYLHRPQFPKRRILI
jgi:hypothetical protein